MVFRPHYRRNYGGKKGIFNFFGLSGNAVDNPPTPPNNGGIDSGLISARRSDSSELPAGWTKDWEALVPDLVGSTEERASAIRFTKELLWKARKG